MTSFTKTAVVALMAGVLGLSALPSVAMAQDRGNGPQNNQQQHRHFQFHQNGGNMQFRLQMPQMRNMGGGMHKGGLLNLVCSENGAERLEIAFVRLSHRLDLTADQQPLFDDLKSTALTAQTEFSDTCATARPAKGGAEAPRPDMVTALKTRLELDTARLAAMNTVLPKLEALYAALTDAQKAALQPRQHDRGTMQKHQGRPMQPGQPMAPAPDAPAPSEG